MAADGTIDLWWLPLGAGGHFVGFNGRVYETLQARREARAPRDLYHTALEVHLGGARTIIENAWPIPDADGASRGVVVEGPVGHPVLGRFRALRYEIRRWPDGVIADARWAVQSPHTVSEDPACAHRILDLVDAVPPLLWGRDQMGTGDMWNSNSVVAWLLRRSGVDTDAIEPPVNGRAPGWTAGLEIADSALVAAA